MRNITAVWLILSWLLEIFCIWISEWFGHKCFHDTGFQCSNFSWMFHWCPPFLLIALLQFSSAHSASFNLMTAWKHPILIPHTYVTAGNKWCCNCVDRKMCAIWSEMVIFNMKMQWKCLWKIESTYYSSMKWVLPVFDVTCKHVNMICVIQSDWKFMQPTLSTYFSHRKCKEFVHGITYCNTGSFQCRIGQMILGHSPAVSVVCKPSNSSNENNEMFLQNHAVYFFIFNLIQTMWMHMGE
jgi:hypothetical protein